MIIDELCGSMNPGTVVSVEVCRALDRAGTRLSRRRLVQKLYVRDGWIDVRLVMSR